MFFAWLAGLLGVGTTTAAALSLGALSIASTALSARKARKSQEAQSAASLRQARNLQLRQDARTQGQKTHPMQASSVILGSSTSGTTTTTKPKAPTRRKVRGGSSYLQGLFPDLY